MDDCISRQAVLALPTSKTRTLSGEIVEEEVDIELIKALPSVTPKEKIGHWIDNHTTCDCCGWQMIDDVMESPNMVFFLFCPNCGAKMIEPQESEKI